MANALARSVEHTSPASFTLLRAELAFYVLHRSARQVVALGERSAFPRSPASIAHGFGELYDVCLALKWGKKVVSNTRMPARAAWLS